MKINRNTIEVVLRDCVERRGMCDHEIAKMLNVGTTTINCWRNRYNIKPADKFHRRFRQKYGDMAEQKFRDLVEQGISLQEIGRQFGFSREYARQVHYKLYGMSYREFVNQRAASSKDKVWRPVRQKTGAEVLNPSESSAPVAASVATNASVATETSAAEPTEESPTWQAMV